MKKSGAILILETLSKKEMKLFEEFLNSPFHNKNTKVVRLFDVIKKHHPHYESEEISKENLFRELSGESAYNEAYIRNLYSDLNILLEKFLQYIHIAGEYDSEKLLISELSSRNINDLVNKKIELFKKKIDSVKSKDQEYYLNRIFIYDLQGLFNSDRSLTDRFMPKSISSKIKLSLITILESYFQYLIEEQRIKISHNFDYLRHTLKYMKEHLNEFNDSPLLLTYYYLWLSFIDADGEDSFLKARKIFKSHFNNLKLMDKKNVYAVIQAFCLKKMEIGVSSYEKVLLNILFEMLKQNVFSHRKGTMSLNLFRNILISCSKLKEIKMMKNFIADYSGHIVRESRPSIIAYSSAHLNFLQGNFAEALQFCSKVNFNKLLITTNENLFFKNDVKSLMLKCLYELDSTEGVLTHIDTYKHFLNNSRLIKESLKKKYMQLINCVGELMKLRSEYDDYRIYRLRKTVEGTKDISGGNWIIEKIEEIEKLYLM